MHFKFASPSVTLGKPVSRQSRTIQKEMGVGNPSLIALAFGRDVISRSISSCLGCCVSQTPLHKKIDAKGSRTKR